MWFFHQCWAHSPCVIGWSLLNIQCGHSGKHLDSADLPLELDTNLSILKVSNLNYLERRVQTLGGSCLHLQLLGVYKYGSPVPHTRERQKLFTGQKLDWTLRLSELRICQTFEVMTFLNGLWLCGWFSFTSLPNLSCYTPTRLWQLLIGVLYLYSPWCGTLVSRVFLVS